MYQMFALYLATLILLIFLMNVTRVHIQVERVIVFSPAMYILMSCVVRSAWKSGLYLMCCCFKPFPQQLHNFPIILLLLLVIFSNLDTLFIFLECFFFQITTEYSYRCIAEPWSHTTSYHVVLYSLQRFLPQRYDDMMGTIISSQIQFIECVSTMLSVYIHLILTVTLQS